MIYAKELEPIVKNRDIEYASTLDSLLEKTLDEIKLFIETNKNFVKTNGIYAFSITDVDLNDETEVEVEQAFQTESFSSIDYIVNIAKKDVMLTYDEYVAAYNGYVEQHAESYCELRIFENILHHPIFWRPFVDSLIQHGFEVRIVNYSIKYSKSLKIGEIPKEGFIVLFKVNE